MPSIDTLIVFEQAAQALSFTKAGAQLGLTQSAVSRQMIDLEALLQVALFARERQRLKLTEAGAEFRELIRPVLQDLRAATLRMQMHAVPNNVLNVSVAASFCNLWLIPNLPGFCAQANAPQVNLMPHVGPVVFGANAIDAAVVNAERPPEHCEYLKLCDLEIGPFAAPSLLRRLGVGRLEDFGRIPAVDIREGNGAWPRYLAHVGLSRIGIDCVASHSLLLLSHEMAVAGLGVALLPPEFVASGRAPGALKRLHPALLALGRSYYFCWPAASKKRETIQALGLWLQRELQVARARGSRVRKG
ncbi:LysR family transcriptional regulator [Hydrogenophaga borbori]|uniref:LysR family transcriptional regulator n=1 Tax=Hydrogenophaga borbori TaxID=2294117 RepID=UPI0015F2A422|nr:LysR family transcriptional regulator [Hydrogenophaga borbori]